MNPELVLGAVAYHPRVVTVWERFKTYFGDAGLGIDYVLYSNYETLVDATASGAVDIGWNTNTAYVALDDRLQGDTVILGMRDVDRDWATLIVARRDTAFQELTDLAGQTVAFGSRDSGHAAILPIYYLSEAGLKAESDYRTLRFDTDLGKHGDTGDSELHVIRAIADGRAQAGAVSQAFFSTMRAERVPEVSDLQVVWRSPSYYHCNFTARTSLDAAIRRRWLDTLLAMDYNDPSLRPAMDLEGVREWHEGDDHGYASLRQSISYERSDDRGEA
jgi:phosphonate transport system substrate-binding protein